MRTPPNERLTSDIADTSRPGKSGPGKACPERKCILSGEHGAREDLLRLAISPAGEVLFDAQAKAPGRGAWIGVSRAELEQAIARKRLRGALARAFKGAPLDVPGDLPERIEKGLLRALTDRMGLEMRAGYLILGNAKIAAAARGGEVRWLGHAADASADGAAKLDQGWRVGSDAEGSSLKGERLPLDREALSVALGRANVVHLALIDPGAARRIETALARLNRFRGAAAPHPGGADSTAAAVTDDAVTGAAAIGEDDTESTKEVRPK